MFAVLGLMNFLFANPIQIKLRKIKRKQKKKKKDEESKGIFDNFTFPFLLAPASWLISRLTHPLVLDKASNQSSEEASNVSRKKTLVEKTELLWM